MSMRGDKPLKSLSLWSIRSIVSVEPFVRSVGRGGQRVSMDEFLQLYSIP